MASTAPRPFLERFRTEPLRGGILATETGSVWLAGAIYCSGYEKLTSGHDNWPGSLWWSAAAVLPWPALFEWSKSASGRRIMGTGWSLAALLCSTAALSLLLEYAVNFLTGSTQPPVALALMRRLPAIGSALILILWSRAPARNRADAPPHDAGLAALAHAIDWIEAADNYVELHIADRTLVRRTTLRDAESMLEGHGFVRIHRRFLVNRRRIASIVGSNGDRVVRLTDGTEFPVGRTFARQFGDLRLSIRPFAT